MINAKYNLDIEPIKGNNIYITNTPLLTAQDSIEIKFSTSK